MVRMKIKSFPTISLLWMTIILILILNLSQIIVKVNAAGYFSQAPGIPSNTIGLNVDRFNPSTPSTSIPIPTAQAHHHLEADPSSQQHGSSSSSSSPSLPSSEEEEESAKQSASSTETFLEALSRNFYVSVLGRTHVEVSRIRDLHRTESSRLENPTWNPKIKRFDSRLPQRLASADQGGSVGERRVGETVEDWLDRVLLSDGNLADFRPWVILVSESSTDKPSREVDELFNTTLNILFPPEGTTSMDWILASTSSSSSSTSPDSGAEKGTMVKKKGAEGSGQDGQSVDFFDSPEDQAEAQVGDDEPGSKSTHGLLTREEKGRIERLETLASSSSSSASRLRFGHIKYIQESTLSWKFWIWKVPLIIFVTPSTSPSQRRYDLRFYKIAWAPRTLENLLSLFNEDKWTRLNVWQSSLAIGASNDRVTSLLARAFEHVYYLLDPIPSWLLMMMSTAGTMGLIGFLHSLDSDSKGQEEKKSDSDGKKVRQLKEVTGVDATSSGGSGSNREGGSRSGSKKNAVKKRK